MTQSAENDAAALDRYADWCIQEVSGWDESVYPNRWANARDRERHARQRASELRCVIPPVKG